MKSTNGDTHLGGDNRPTHHRLADPGVQARSGIDVSRPDGLQRLKEAGESQDKLSSLLETEINLPFLTRMPAAPSTWP
jgi:molecular chaperone DnaK (HSP70)